MLESMVSSFLDTYFDAMLNPTIVQRLRDAQISDQYTIILSSAPNFLVKAIANRFGVDAWAATEYSVVEDQTVGAVTEQMDGDDKAKFVAELISRLEISKGQIAGYTDSLLDYPFLQAVGHPIVVNPGKTLRKLSLQNHWEILDTK